MTCGLGKMRYSFVRHEEQKQKEKTAKIFIVVLVAVAGIRVASEMARLYRVQDSGTR